jgi:hypothetical protein
MKSIGVSNGSIDIKIFHPYYVLHAR